jgi:hypothetical protein
MQHLSQEARNVRPATEPKHVDLVSKIVVMHEKSTPAHNMFTKGRANYSILLQMWI